MEPDRARERAETILKNLPPGIRRLAFRLLSGKIINMVRMQMLYNIGNGWSWYAYKKLGPDGIIDVELEMWDNLMPPAVERLLSLIEPTGTTIQKSRKFLDQLCKLNCYRKKYLEETSQSLTWEYTYCPNWDSMLQMELDDYLAMNGKPALVSCQPGCTRIHEIYFKAIDPHVKVDMIKKRPQADNTCILRLECENHR